MVKLLGIILLVIFRYYFELVLILFNIIESKVTFNANNIIYQLQLKL